MNIDIVIPFKDSLNHLPNICQDLSLQTYNNFEVLFVSDNSIDGSVEFLKSKSFPFSFKIIQSNGEGPGSARNFGINNSYNQFLTFIDVDDRIDSNYIEEFTCAAMNTDADVIECMFKSVSPDGGVISGTDIASFLSSKDRFLALLEGSIPRLSWGKLYKRSFQNANDAYFPEGIHNGEDHIFLLKLYSANPHVELIFKKMYSWVRHSNSLTNRTPTEKTVEDFIKVSELKFEFFNSYADQADNNELSDLIFSRRFFKEARMLQQQIKSDSTHSDFLICNMREKIISSSKLDKVKALIEHDTTSYWKDVM